MIDITKRIFDFLFPNGSKGIPLIFDDKHISK